jgi:hypothetical protein
MEEELRDVVMEVSTDSQIFVNFMLNMSRQMDSIQTGANLFFSPQTKSQPIRRSETD